MVSDVDDPLVFVDFDSLVAVIAAALGVPDEALSPKPVNTRQSHAITLGLVLPAFPRAYPSSRACLPSQVLSSKKEWEAKSRAVGRVYVLLVSGMLVYMVGFALAQAIRERRQFPVRSCFISCVVCDSVCDCVYVCMGVCGRLCVMKTCGACFSSSGNKLV